MQLEVDSLPRVADESAHPGCPVEWWFVQGRFEGEKFGAREFMVTLFRHSLEWRDLSAGNSSTLLVSVLDPQSDRAASLTQINRTNSSFLAAALKKAPPAGLDPIAIRAAASELSEYGPPRPIQVTTDRAFFGSNPFFARWGQFELQQEQGNFRLQFIDPELGRKHCFRLRPIRPRMCLSDVEVAGGGAMDYAIYTRLNLEGGVDGEAVRGRVWMEHQWGSQGWFAGGDRKERLLGWDWLAIQFDDERDLMVTIHREQKTGKVLSQYALLMNAQGEAQLFHDFAVTPAARWNSSHTGTAYPVARNVRIPELGMDLDFVPLVDDQEIAMLPPFRAIWQGAGRVQGTCAGRPVSGRARLELHGYAYLLDLRQQLDASKQRIRRHLANFLPPMLRHEDVERLAGTPAHGRHDPEAQTEMLSKPLWDLIDRDGRQWWAVFGTLMIAALGTNSQPYELLASVTAEMLHEGAVMIDDIHDRGRIRRGQECIHLRYGMEVAISAGNTAYFLPMVLLADYPGLTDVQRLELYRVLSRLFIRAHLGQAQDLHWSNSLTVKRLNTWMADSLEAKIIQVYDQKTASLTEAAAEGAAVIACADAKTKKICADFGRNLGVIMQIVNDIANFSAPRVALGSAGSDLAEGKITYVIIRALKKLDGSNRERLKAIFCSPELRGDSSALAEAVELVRRSGALEISQKHATELLEKEWKKLSTVVPPSEPKLMLRVLCTFLLHLCDDERFAEFASA